MDYNLLKPKEILSKLHDISSEIIGLYEKIIKLVEEGKNLDEYLSLMTKLKILIFKETAIMKSLSNEKILSCRLAIKGEGIIIALMDSTIDYNLEDDDLFAFPKDESIEIKSRVSNRLFHEQQEREGETISFPLSIAENQSMTVQLSKFSTFMSLIDIKLIKELKQQFEKGYTNINMDNSINEGLKRELNIQFIKLLMGSSALEYLTFLFNSSPKIDETLDNSIEVIEEALDDSSWVNIVSNLGQQVVGDLAKVDIDVSDSSSVMNSDIKEIYKYISNITKLDILLSYADMTILEKIKDFFEGGTTKEQLISLALEYGTPEQAESLNVNLKDDHFEKYADFKSSSVEDVVDNVLYKCRQRLLSNGKN